MPHSSEPIVAVALVLMIVVALAFVLFLTPISKAYYGVKKWLTKLKKPSGTTQPKKK